MSKESLRQNDKDKNTNDCRGSQKQLFEQYMSTEDVSAGLKRGELIQVNLVHANLCVWVVHLTSPAVCSPACLT